MADYDECFDTIWMVYAAIFVFFMQCGFAMLESGCVCRENSTGILCKNVLDCALGFGCWYVIGYALAFGVADEPTKFAGSTNFFMQGFWESRDNFRVWFFQGAFCATGGTIVSGAMAERTRLEGFAVFTVVMTSFIYPCIVYWGWSGSGLLNYEDAKGEAVSIVGPPLIDFAGSGIVHLSGGMAAFMGVIIVGGRDHMLKKWALEKERAEARANGVPLMNDGSSAAPREKRDSDSESDSETKEGAASVAESEGP